MIFRIVVILIQFVALIFIGGFGRSLQAISSTSYLTNNQLLIVSWVIMYSPFKKLSLHSAIVVLLLSGVVFEAQILFGIFWEYVFQGFNGQFNITTRLLIEASFAQLAIVLIAMDFVGVFRYWQIFFIFGLTCAFGYAFNSAILLYGLDIFDSGGGIRIFAYSGMAALMIWVVAVRARANVHWLKIDQHYHGQTLSLFGLIGVFLTWPTFNASGGYLSFFNANIGLSVSNTLVFCGYYNSFLGFIVAFSLAFIFYEHTGVKESKIKVRSFVDGFVNCGIAFACFVAIELNPAASLVLTFICSILNLLFYKYFKKTNSSRLQTQVQENRFKLVMIVFQRYCRPIFRILMPLLGVIFCAIVLATRQSRTPTLLIDGTDYGLIAGLQIVGYLITLIIAAIFGAVSGILINLFMNFKQPQENENQEEEVIAEHQLNIQNLTDFIFFQDLMQSGNKPSGIVRDQEQLFPIYLQKDDAYVDEHQTARKMIRQTMLSHIKQNNQTQKKADNQQNLKNDNYQTKALCSRIIKNSDTPRKSMLKHQKSETQFQKSVKSKSLSRIRSQKITRQDPLKINHKKQVQNEPKRVSLASQKSPHFNDDLQLNNTIQNQNKHRGGLLVTSQKPQIRMVNSSIDLNIDKKPNIKRRISYGARSQHSSDIGDQFNKD